MKEFLIKNYPEFSYRNFAVKGEVTPVPTVLFVADILRQRQHKSPEIPTDITDMMGSLNRKEWLPDKKKKRKNANLGGATYTSFSFGSDDDDGGSGSTQRPKAHLTLRRK